MAKSKSAENESQQSVAGEPLVVTVDQAAALLSLGRVSVYKLLRSGKLEARHFGRATRITRRGCRSVRNIKKSHLSTGQRR
jgi:excisionase family DNA binding protein